MEDNKNREQYLERLDQIIKKSEETGEKITELDKKLDLHIQKTEYEISGIKELDHQQNESLREHIEGVKTLKKMHQAQTDYFETRIEKLERPGVVWGYIEKWFLRLGGIAGAVYAVGRVVGWWS